MEAVGEGGVSDINISDVMDVIDSDPAFGNGQNQIIDQNMSNKELCLKIIEQPAPKALRFRYECEGRSAGSIPGINSTPENKTYPTVKLENYKGKAMILASCVTKDYPYRTHPHNLVGKEGCKRGVCTIPVNTETMTAVFSNLGIQCVKKKDIEQALADRESQRIDPFKVGFAHKTQSGSLDLNCVRICFQAFLEGPNPNEYKRPLQPVVSDPIYDKKATSDLSICKLSHCSAPVVGGLEMILLCEKVNKDDVEIIFSELNQTKDQVIWQANGDFLPTHVHKQVAISFRTPAYRNLQITEPVQAYIHLYRPSDKETSPRYKFSFTPVLTNPDKSSKKRPRIDSETSFSLGQELKENVPKNLPSEFYQDPNIYPIKKESLQQGFVRYGVFWRQNWGDFSTLN